MQIELGWPHKALSPNHRSRSHWPKTRATKAAVNEAFFATKAAIGRGEPEHDGRLSFIITAYPPDRQARDDDNLVSSLKGHRDGIAKALGLDDKLFDLRPVQWAEPVKNGRIVVTLEAQA